MLVTFHCYLNVYFFVVVVVVQEAKDIDENILPSPSLLDKPMFFILLCQNPLRQHFIL